MKTRDWSLIRVTCGDHSIRYRERTVTSGLCLRWVGPPSCPGPVRVCLGKERGRKKDRKGVRKDIPMSPLHIQHQGLIWNGHGRSQRHERECLKKKKAVLRGWISTGTAYECSESAHTQMLSCCWRSYGWLTLWSRLSSIRILVLRKTLAPSCTAQNTAGKVGCETKKSFEKKRKKTPPKFSLMISKMNPSKSSQTHSDDWRDPAGRIWK